MSRVDDLIAAGYQQVSRKHRLLARVPTGLTGLEALRTVDPFMADRMEKAVHDQAADYYRRVHSKEQVELTREEFEEYLTKTRGAG